MQDISDIGLRIEICTLADEAIGTYILYDICSCKKDEVTKLIVELDTSNLVCNDYKSRYTFFLKDQYGSNHDIDYADGLCFRIINLDDDVQMSWNIKNWGSVQLPLPKILDLK